MNIVWFRQDFRLMDNPALYYAAKKNSGIIPVYIYDPSLYLLGGASRWWLHHSLKAMQECFKEKNIHFVILQGHTNKVLLELAKKHKADAVFWNRSYEPRILKQDIIIARKLNSAGIETQSFCGNLLYDPDSIKNNKGAPYKVFSQYWKACQKVMPQRLHTLPMPKLKGAPYRANKQLDSLELLPKNPDWSGGIQEMFHPGELNALKKLKSFINKKLVNYAKFRDFPAEDVTSLLSPHLRFGEISPLKVWQEVKKTEFEFKGSAEKLILELGWREFSAYLLYHFPKLATQNINQKFNNFSWQKNKSMLKKWQQGKTGYPIIDAGMRQLWHTGYMHNRVRMIVASFLTKDLFIHWKIGANWFMDTLVDADLASNSVNWQWVAGTGVDASPYFRIFNPVTQGKKFDPKGIYVRQWVPELSKLPNQYIHNPWTAPSHILKEAQVVLGKNYAFPIVIHEKQRKLALELFKVKITKS